MPQPQFLLLHRKNQHPPLIMTKTPPPSLPFISFLLLFILPFHGNSQTINVEEQSILFNLKQYWSNPLSIKHWIPSPSSATHCTWPEINCTGGSVTGITLIDINIAGDIPPFICDLKNLTRIDLSVNEIPGPFPTILYNCTNLQYLDLSHNFFVGQIPADIHRLSPRLQFLSLGANNFTGDIPAAIAWFPELTTLHLYQNLFNGTFPPEIGNLSNLEVLGLSFNGFSHSTIPASFANLTKLKDLRMTESRLIGEIPESLGDLTALEFIDLSENYLSGNIPRIFGKLKKLTYLDLSSNDLSGQIPSEIVNLRLNSLDLSYNSLTGQIPGPLISTPYWNSFLGNRGLCVRVQFPGVFAPHFDPCPSNTRKTSKIILIVGSVASVLFFLVVLSFFLCRIRTFRGRKHGLDTTWKLISFHRLTFTESTILSSLTENNAIGSGGSGKVYRVPINCSGESVAVKRIWNNKKLDHNLEKQFNSEIKILSTIRHSNIVKLLCCISSETSKLLVYPYFENRSLDQWLHGKRRSSSSGSASVHHVVLEWPKRLQIAVGAARGLCYMHHDCSPPIIHRDVKSSNILLDSEFNAQLADFGLARISIKHGGLNTMSAMAGTFGYIAPEYTRTTRVNEKIDVYSFGVVLLELVTGKEANKGGEYTNLAEWSWQHIQEGYPIADVLDSEIKEPCNLDEMIGVFKLGIICTGTVPSTRPNMKEVMQILLRLI